MTITFAKRWKEQVNAARQTWAAYLACGSPSCARLQRFSKRVRRREPSIMRLDGARYCFPRCFDSALQGRFDQLLRSSVVKPRRPHRIPLGLLMLAHGDIDARQLHDALSAQRNNGRGRIGEWIEYMGYAREAQVTAAISAQWACPVLPGLPEPLIAPSLPLALLRCYRMAPVHYVKSSRLLHVAFSDAVDYAALLAIEQTLECQAQPCIISSSALDALLGQLEEKPRRPDQVFGTTHSANEMARVTSSHCRAFAAQGVRLARCGPFIWARVQANDDSANLLFPVEELRENFAPMRAPDRLRLSAAGA